MRPLEGILVLDLSRVLAGPYCTMQLADMGATVIKVEEPRGGDDTRAFGPPFVGGESCYYLSVNRGKRSIAIDLKHPEGKAIVRKLASRADVLVENFRPGAADRLGLGYTGLTELNPRLIYASISGFGHAGLPEFFGKPGYDVVVQGLGGGPSITGEPDGEPMKSGNSIADLIAGLLTFQGILLALLARERSGRGQHVDISMLDGQVSLLTYHAGRYLGTGDVPRRMGNRHPTIVPYQTFRAADGYFNLAVGNDRLWESFCKAIARPDLLADTRYTANSGRVRHREELIAVLAEFFRQEPVEHWLALLEKSGVPAGPILDLSGTLEHP
ncbi:MAG: CoA transferase, partial [Deltaproteobacteria bacterium]|nr:CoA transferase [Deltaproteobacteria bacterium]